MSTVRKIAVPFDKSENAVHALRHAVALIKELGQGEVHIVHVHETALSYGRSAAYVPATKIEHDLDEESAKILGPALAIAKEGGVTCKTAILSGAPGEAIVHYVEENGCTGIVMGTRGISIGSMLIGSVATKVIHLSQVPVTLVK
jgi:nucleotide-binding universal stress UspA family protein